jgi:hypothetical protein
MVGEKSGTRKKIEYLRYDSSKRVGCFMNDKGMFKLYIHKDMLKEILC